MTIEFHTAFGKVSEKLIKDIRNEIMKLSHINKDISRAEVMLKYDQALISAENKICEIKLTIFGDALHARARTENFDSASREAIKELARMVKQQVRKQKEPMDPLTSSVKV
jgi:ribosome-associated translation inhibitor RaiA